MSDDEFEDVPDVAEDLSRAEQRLRVHVEERRYGKPMTVVEGFDPGVVDVQSVAATLKRSLAAGGTVEDNKIELQGDHEADVRELLREEGFNVEEA